MRTSVRGAKPATRLRCEQLEDRLTPALAYALTDEVAPNLISFDTAAPVGPPLTAVAINGITAGEVLVGIDFRPADGQLYGLGVNATTDTATLYRINLTTGALTAVGTASSIALTTDGTTAVELPDPTAVGYGFDFNPAVDRIRVVAGNLNFRINPNNGAAVDGNNTGNATPVVDGINPDAPITLSPLGGAFQVDAAAYANSRATTGGATALFTLDAGTDSLYTQNANGGVQTLRGVLMDGMNPIDFTAINGFDIAEAGTTTGLAVLTVGGITGLYSINLADGATTPLGPVGTPLTGIRGFALQPAGTIQFQSTAVNVSETDSAAIITLTRVGGTAGTLTATVNVSGGTAVGGTDFTNSSPYTVTFADGQATATITIPLLNDTVVDGTKTINLTIAAVNGLPLAAQGAIGTLGAATVTINDDETPPSPPVSPPPAPPADPTPVFNNAVVVGGLLVLTGPGVTGGAQIIPVPNGSSAFLSDLTGDGLADVVLTTPTGVVVLNGATGQLSLIATDVTGDNVPELFVFNDDGSFRVIDSRTGQPLVA